jgi:hypothetical protein
VAQYGELARSLHTKRHLAALEARVPHGSATKNAILIGESMKKYARILVAVTFLLGFSVAANAQMQPQIAVTLPFAFVVNGKTLPAGSYTVKRFSPQPYNVLMLTSNNSGTSVFVNPTEMEGASNDKPKVIFRNVGEQHFLSVIQTEDYVYNFSVPRGVILEAAAKQLGAASPLASGGSK